MSTSTSTLPTLPNTDPSTIALDEFRVAVAKHISDALPALTIEQAFSGVDFGKKGEDFTVALPRYRLPGKVDEIAKQVIDNVRVFYSNFLVEPITDNLTFSSNRTTTFRPSPTTDLSSISP